MTEHEQKMFNAHADRVKALEWRNRLWSKLDSQMNKLSHSEQIALLRQIEALLA